MQAYVRSSSGEKRKETKPGKLSYDVRPVGFLATFCAKENKPFTQTTRAINYWSN